MKPQENGLNKMVEGKKHKFQGFSEASRRLPGGLLEAYWRLPGFPVFHTKYGHSKGNGNM